MVDIMQTRGGRLFFIAGATWRIQLNNPRTPAGNWLIKSDATIFLSGVDFTKENLNFHDLGTPVIFGRIVAVHAQKLLSMSFRRKFR